MQRDESVLAFDGNDQVAMVVVGIDLEGHQLAAGGEHRVRREHVLPDAARLDIAELHRVAA